MKLKIRFERKYKYNEFTKEDFVKELSKILKRPYPQPQKRGKIWRTPSEEVLLDEITEKVKEKEARLIWDKTP